MPVSPTQILAALDRKRQDFTQFDLTIQQDLTRYRQVWRQFTQAGATVGPSLPSGPVGARPLEPFDRVQGGVLPFPQQWDSREASLVWVREQLSGITTFAVDGSQIFPSKDVSLPVALVQIGWFENPHREDGRYTKDIQLDVLTPADLKTDRLAEPVDRRVNIRRFEMEVQCLIDYMAQCETPDDTLVFFDGSLVVTFADAFDPDSQRAYVEAMVNLLAASDRYRVPLVGYVDTSYARDLTSLLPHWSAELSPVEALHDAQMLSVMMDWGDRTPLLTCDRDGILDKYGDQRDQVMFTYVQTTRDRPPARLELPRWLWETGQAETVVDWVRAEVIVGGGYPYAIETADQTAVIQGGDRQLFYRILQEWSDREALQLRFSRKMISKTRRR
jgi:hypothetical protein